MYFSLILKNCHCYVTIDFTYVVQASQSIFQNVFTHVEELFVISESRLTADFTLYITDTIKFCYIFFIHEQNVSWASMLLPYIWNPVQSGHIWKLSLILFVMFLHRLLTQNDSGHLPFMI